jgi:hypothetical protein
MHSHSTPKLVSSKTAFPREIQGLTFVRVLSDIVVRSIYTFALYQNAAGKKFVFKMWNGKNKNEDYHWLCNEIQIYKALANISSSKQKQLLEKYPQISIPHMVTNSITDTKVFLVLSYAEGVPISTKYTDAALLKTYTDVTSYLRELSTKTKIIHDVHAKRKAMHFFVLFHYYLLKALRHNFTSFITLAQSIIPFYRGMFYLQNDREEIFLHRDLGGYNNILVNKKTISILDLQLSCIGHPLVEWANIVVTKCNNTSFFRAFFASEIYSHIKSDPKQKMIFCALLLYGAIFDLSSGVEKTKNESLSLLHTALSL